MRARVRVGARSIARGAAPWLATLAAACADFRAGPLDVSACDPSCDAGCVWRSTTGSGCAVGEQCLPVDPGGQTACVALGDGGLAAACTADGDCRLRFVCVAGECRHLCAAGSTTPALSCIAATTCTPMAGRPDDFGVCQ